MILVFPTAKNINHTLIELSPTIDEERIDLDVSEASGINLNRLTNTSLNSSYCGTNFDITKYIPLWVVYEKQERIDNGEANPVSIFDFLQKYYDWLYCDLPGGGEYNLSQRLLNLIDIETTKKQYYKNFLFTYASGIDERFLAENGGPITDLAIESFINGIRRNVYLRKTNLEAVIYFFKTLFSVNEEDVKIYYPKENILRLNGGKFEHESFEFSGLTGTYSQIQTLGGSYLNFGRLQDSDWIQDYSYLLKVGLPVQEYTEVYKEVLHPAGLRVVFEKEISDYEGPGEGEDTNLLCEYPVLKNYSAYRMGTTYNTIIGVTYGINLYGLTCCNGFSSGFTLGFTGPSHYFPNWDGNITASRFNDINIFDFFTMCYSAGFTSPNDGVTCSPSPC
jgi:hypothetical protein